MPVTNVHVGMQGLPAVQLSDPSDDLTAGMPVGDCCIGCYEEIAGIGIYHVIGTGCTQPMVS